MATLRRDDVDRSFAEIRERYREARDHYVTNRRGRELECALFYRGEQDRHSYEAYDELGMIPDDEGRENQNIVRRIVRAATAIALRQLPNPSLPATKGDQDARARADMTERFIRSASRNGIIDWDEVTRAVNWSKQVGLGWVKCGWDPDAGRLMHEPTDTLFMEDEELAATEDEFGEIVTVRPPAHQGQIFTRFVSTEDGLPNPNLRTRREMRYYFESRLMTVDEAREIYPVDIFGEKVTSYDTGADESAMGRRAYGDNDPSYGSRMCRVVEMWQAPSRRWRYGRLCIFSGPAIFYYGRNPLIPARIPYIPFFGDNLNPLAFAPDGVVKDLRSPQNTLNFAYSKIYEHLDKIANAQIMVPFGAGVDKKQFVNKAGRIIEYQKGYKPDFWTPPEVPSSLFAAVQDLREFSTQVSGYDDVNQGSAPNVDLSGRAMMLMSEKEQLTREPEMISVRRSFFDLYQHIVWCARQFYTEDYLVDLLGEDNRWEVVRFKRDKFDLETEIIPEVYSGEPTTPAIQFNETLEMLAAGLFDGTPRAKAALARLGDRYIGKSTVDPNFNHRMKARRHIDALKNDPFAEVHADVIDHHETHRDELVNFMVSSEFERLDPMLQQKFMMLLEEHEELLSAQELEFARSQAMLEGGAPVDAPMDPGVSAAGLESPSDGGHPLYPPTSPMSEGFSRAPDEFRGAETEGLIPPLH